MGNKNLVGEEISKYAYGMKKDVIITFPMWTSYKSKFNELNRRAKKFAKKKCGEKTKYQIIGIQSYGFGGTSSMSNSIGGNILCQKKMVVKDIKSDDDKEIKKKINKYSTNKKYKNKFLKWSDNEICQMAINKSTKKFDNRAKYSIYVVEAQKRGLKCGIKEKYNTSPYKTKCSPNTYSTNWNNCIGARTWPSGDKYIGEYKKGRKHGKGTYYWSDGGKYIGQWENGKQTGQGTHIWSDGGKYVGEWKNGKQNGRGIQTWRKGGKYVGQYKDGEPYGHGTHIWSNGDKYVGQYKDGKENGFGTYIWRTGHKYVGEHKDGREHGKGIFTWSNGDKYVGEFRYGKRNGFGTYTDRYGKIKQGIWKNSKFLYAKRMDKNNQLIDKSFSEFQKEKQKRLQLERKLAELKAKQKREKQRIYRDTDAPLLKILSSKTEAKKGTIIGIVKDNVKVAEVTIDGKPIYFSPDGGFKYSTYVPPKGVEITIKATDSAGLTSSKNITLKQDNKNLNNLIVFDRLNPLGKKVFSKPDALALIVGVSSYENTKAKALFADNDALVFRDYASEKLGIKDNKIKILINDGAGEKDILLAVKEWLHRSSKKNISDIFIFFAGHGLASDDGKDMYLLPYDGSPRLLEDTAIFRKRLFNDIQKSKPRSVTVFLDTCYSGETRNNEMLVDGRPIIIRETEQSIPKKFTLFSAASNEQISRPLKEAKHGMFSYFLMKGMEGEADLNQDKIITALELHNYVRENVIQQSSGSQTPELQGDKDRVLVKFR